MISCEFNKKYTKGSVLFVVLLIYEVPIVLNFLLFLPRRDGPRIGFRCRHKSRGSETAAAKAS